MSGFGLVDMPMRAKGGAIPRALPALKLQKTWCGGAVVQSPGKRETREGRGHDKKKCEDGP